MKKEAVVDRTLKVCRAHAVEWVSKVMDATGGDDPKALADVLLEIFMLGLAEGLKMASGK